WERFASALPSHEQERHSWTFIVASAGRILGYSNLLVKSEDESYAHAHILDKKLRNQGLASVLFIDMIKIFFTHCPIQKLTFQTSPENKRINALIQKFGLIPKKTYLSEPDGMARPGEFYIYEITRAAFDSIQRQKRLP